MLEDLTFCTANEYAMKVQPSPVNSNIKNDKKPCLIRIQQTLVNTFWITNEDSI